MNVRYAEAVAYLDDLGIDAMHALSPSTHRIEALCEALDHPEQRVPAIHITGTNGKTSCARMITSLLSATGLTVGTYTSPHLQSVRERIALNSEPISTEDFAEVFSHVLPYVQSIEQRLGERISYFEILTGMFFLWAADAPVDAVVVEVGLGGRWDATNVVPADVAVITNIGLDHTQMMGNDRLAIAREKAGIIKPGTMLVTSERAPDALAILGEATESAGALASIVDRDFALVEDRVAFGGRYFSARTSVRDHEDLFVPLHGSHQSLNATTALEAVTRFLPGKELDNDVVSDGLAGTLNPGRLEMVMVRGTEDGVLLDVAHNPDGVATLVKALLEDFTFDSITFVVGILADKDHVAIMRELARTPCRLIVTEAKSARAVPAAKLRVDAEALEIKCEEVIDVAGAIDVAVKARKPGELICVTGSHYVVGEARDHLLRRLP